MKPVPAICMRFQKRLVVSCQAPEGDIFRDPESMARFALAAVVGGAAAIRANGPEDIRAIRKAVQVPIIGIQKTRQADGRVLITPSVQAARELVEAGADVIALDCTARGQRYCALDRLGQIRSELGVPVMADIATTEEAVAAAAAGADIVATTLRGYTPETEEITAFEPTFVAALARRLEIPVVAEGRIEVPEKAGEAMRAGAFAVVVGTAITCPEEITRRFVRAVEVEQNARTKAYFLGIDLGGTRTKFGIVSSEGELIRASSEATPAGGGREVLLGHLRRVAKCSMEMARQAELEPAALGVATAGWVDPCSGRVAYATENLPGWTGASVADVLQEEVGLPVAVENDANALAVAEKHFGLARELNDFVCITLGTGLGGGCYTGGRLNRGAHFFASALGHIAIQHNGLPCTCGQRGCLEVYTNAAALLRYGESVFSTAEELIAAANSGDPAACGAIREYAGYLTTGIAAIIHLLDPEMVVISGGIAQDNSALLAQLGDQLPKHVIAWDRRQVRVGLSQLGYYGGVLGAAALAKEKLDAGCE